jgi:AraC-like DNA-binding protein
VASVKLDRLFDNLAVQIEPFAMCEVADGSRLEIGALGWVTVHFTLAGTGWIRVGRDRPLRLAPYTLVLVRRGHLLTGELNGRSSRAGLITKVAGVKRLVGEPEGPPDFVIACGRFQATYGRGLGLFDLMPDPVAVDLSDSEEVQALFQRMLVESGSGAPGSRGMIAGLMQQCLVLLFRRFAEDDDLRLACLDALDDSRMLPVLEAILDRPDGAHSLESLARLAAMSRSTFIRRFGECFGRTPMAFLRDVRLRRGAELLKTTPLSVGEIARRVGFSSRSHFSEVFRVAFGQSPIDFRKEFASR